MTTATNDPLDSAMEEKQEKIFTKHYFGEVVIVDAEYYILKGGKKLFDLTVHPIGDRCTEIMIEIQPLVGQFTIKRNAMDFTDEWQKYTLPSIKRLGKVLKELVGTFVHVTLEPVAGKKGTYTNAAGEVKQKTAIVFVEVFADRQACEDAAAAFFGGDDDPPVPATPAAQASPAVTAPAAPEVQVDKSALLPFLELTWKASGHDQEKFLAAIASTPMLSAVFNAQSPEVAKFIDDIPF